MIYYNTRRKWPFDNLTKKTREGGKEMSQVILILMGMLIVSVAAYFQAGDTISAKGIFGYSILYLLALALMSCFIVAFKGASPFYSKLEVAAVVIGWWLTFLVVAYFFFFRSVRQRPRQTT